MTDWNNMNFSVPEKFGEPCIVRTRNGNYYIATFELSGLNRVWIARDSRLLFNVTHWAYITPIND